MQPLILDIRSNKEANAVLGIVAEWHAPKEIRRVLTTYITEGQNFSSAQMRKRGIDSPLQVALLPTSLDNIVALAKALHGIPEAPRGTIRDYIRNFYPAESVEIAFRGKGEPIRLRNALFRGGYYTLSQIRAATDGQLLDVEGVDKLSLGRIRLLSARGDDFLLGVDEDL